MSSIVALVDWTTPSGRPHAVAHLLDLLPERSVDGTWIRTLAEATIGLSLRATTYRQKAASDPIFVDHTGGLAVACDARIDNLPELHRRLDLPQGTTSDAEVIAAAYRRWDIDVARFLDGDFAFVIWDRSQARVYAARDRCGVRSLHYRDAGGPLLVATEAVQILEDQGTPKELEPRAILDHLTWRYEYHRVTFFKAIQRIQPGHYLLATREARKQVRYWDPPTGQLQAAPLEEYAHEFAVKFRHAVEERLVAPAHVLMHLSGGLDSSSIVSVAAESRRRNPATAPSMSAVGAVFPGLDCDEADYIEAVRSKTGVPLETWDGSAEPACPDELHTFDRASPNGRMLGIGNGPPRDLEIGKRLGARVLLTGEGGNQVTTEPSLVALLLRHGHLLGAARNAFRRLDGPDPLGPRMRRGLGRLWRSKYELLPSALKRGDRERLVENVWLSRDMPTWLGPSLKKLWPGPLPDRDRTHRVWADPRQRSLWDQLTNPREAYVIDFLDLCAARFGIETRMPFCDRSLAEFMMSIPEEALTSLKERRGLHKMAMADLLPSRVTRRRQGVAFTASHVHHAARSSAMFANVLFGTQWVSGDYVDQDAARALLGRVNPANPTAREWLDWTALRDIVCLEIWMRGI